MVKRATPRPAHIEQECRVENEKLVDCNDAEVLNWGKPLLERLTKAVAIAKKAISARHQQYAKDHDERALNDTLLERIDLNRYLESDFKNMKIYRLAVVNRLKGGDPEPYDPLTTIETWGNGTPLLRDIDSHLHDAESILRDLKSLSDQLANQK